MYSRASCLVRVVSDFESVVGNNAFIGIIICCLVMHPGILTARFCRSCACLVVSCRLVLRLGVCCGYLRCVPPCVLFVLVFTWVDWTIVFVVVFVF